MSDGDQRLSVSQRVSFETRRTLMKPRPGGPHNSCLESRLHLSSALHSDHLRAQLVQLRLPTRGGGFFVGGLSQSRTVASNVEGK